MPQRGWVRLRGKGVGVHCGVQERAYWFEKSRKYLLHELWTTMPVSCGRADPIFPHEKVLIRHQQNQSLGNPRLTLHLVRENDQKFMAGNRRHLLSQPPQEEHRQVPAHVFRVQSTRQRRTHHLLARRPAWRLEQSQGKTIHLDKGLRWQTWCCDCSISLGNLFEEKPINNRGFNVRSIQV